MRCSCLSDDTTRHHASPEKKGRNNEKKHLGFLLGVCWYNIISSKNPFCILTQTAVDPTHVHGTNRSCSRATPCPLSHAQGQWHQTSERTSRRAECRQSELHSNHRCQRDCHVYDCLDLSSIGPDHGHGQFRRGYRLSICQRQQACRDFHLPVEWFLRIG